MSIREELPTDRGAVFRIHAAAFDTDAEARLVDALRDRARPLVSLVADVDGEVVGHILFSPVRVRERATRLLMGLAPMAVSPAFQRRGIGSQLVIAGIERCRALGAMGIVVLGHPEFYPRFGFTPAHQYGLRCTYEAPPEAFMVLESAPEALLGISGTIEYHDAFELL